MIQRNRDLRGKAARSRRIRPLLLAAWLAVGTPVLAQQSAEPAAQAPAAPITWSSLAPEQQRLLSGFNGEWKNLPPARQQALAQGSQRWLSMSDAQRQQASERFSRWRALPPEERAVLRNRWQNFQSLTPAQQAAMRQNFHRFQQLPPQRRQYLREQWRNASPGERRQMIEQARAQRQREFGRPLPHPPPRPHR
ncbi:MAG: DUF3106 domain-containing protein [Proteobacteria bacterium]|nr:DUF3106 domain-containing protein [Pseudomonadota bacterium]